MQRWTGGSRTRGEDRRQGGREGFFQPPQPKPFAPPLVSQLPPPPLGALADTTNAVRDLTTKQVQRSVDAQTLRWAVRSPVSCDRQRKKHRGEAAAPSSAPPPLDVSPIALPEGSPGGLLDFSVDPAVPFLYSNLSVQPHDPHHATLPFQSADTSGGAGDFSASLLFAPMPQAPPPLFNTGRDMLHFTPEQQQRQWEQQQQQQQQQQDASRWQHGFGGLHVSPQQQQGVEQLPLHGSMFPAQDDHGSHFYMQPQPSYPPQLPFQQPSVGRPHPRHAAAAAPWPLPSTRPWAQPPGAFQPPPGPSAGDLFFTPFASSSSSHCPFS